MVKQMISDWSTKSLGDFQKALTEKDTASCFDILKDKATGALLQGDSTQQDMRPQDNSGNGRQEGVEEEAEGEDEGEVFPKAPLPPEPDASIVELKITGGINVLMRFMTHIINSP